KITPDAKVLYVVQNMPKNDRPRVFAMVSNFDGQKFDAALLRRMLATAASRQAAAIQPVDAAQQYGLAGITVDFEEVPDDLLDPMFEFMRFLRAGLAPGGRLLTSAVAVSTDEALARRYAAADDYVFLMLYDEHYGSGDPGARRVRHRLERPGPEAEGRLDPLPGREGPREGGGREAPVRLGLAESL